MYRCGAAVEKHCIVQDAVQTVYLTLRILCKLAGTGKRPAAGFPLPAGVYARRRRRCSEGISGAAPPEQDIRYIKSVMREAACRCPEEGGDCMEDKPGLQSTVPMKIAKIGYILLSITLCALGVIRIAEPEFPNEEFGVLCGFVFIVFGCIRLIGFYSKDLYRLAFQYDFEFGILIIVFGLLFFIRPGNLTSMTCVLLGILVLADALFKIRITLQARKFGIEVWWILLIISIAAAVVGGILVFYFAEKLQFILGITLIAEGTLSLATALALVKIIHYQIREENLGQDVTAEL